MGRIPCSLGVYCENCDWQLPPACASVPYCARNGLTIHESFDWLAVYKIKDFIFSEHEINKFRYPTQVLRNPF